VLCHLRIVEIDDGTNTRVAGPFDDEERVVFLQGGKRAVNVGHQLFPFDFAVEVIAGEALGEQHGAHLLFTVGEVEVGPEQTDIFVDVGTVRSDYLFLADRLEVADVMAPLGEAGDEAEADGGLPDILAGGCDKEGFHELMHSMNLLQNKGLKNYNLRV